MPEPDIFISYAREDRETVRRLAGALAQKGWRVWWDTDIRHGQNYRSSIKKALEQAGCVIAVWSQYSVDSDWVLDESGYGYRKNILVPVTIGKGIDPPLGFGGIQTADLSPWLEDETQTSSFDDLCRDIAALLGEPGAQPQSAPPVGPQRTPVPASVPPTRLWGWGAVLCLSAILAGTLYLYPRLTETPETEVQRPAVPVKNTPPVNESAPARRETGRSPLDDLWCSLSSDRNPIAARAAEIAGADYSVNPERHLLLNKEGSPVSVAPATSLGHLKSRRLIVVHFSAAPASGVGHYLQQPEVSASIHVMIARDGTVKQFVPFDYAARHAGPSHWKDLTGLNGHSLGIDLENWGQLHRRDGVWHASSDRVVPAEEVTLVNEGEASAEAGWHKYTDAQLRAFFEVACALRRAYPTIEDIVGHEQISQAGKSDPGPAFPMEEMRRHLFPGRSSEPERDSE